MYIHGQAYCSSLLARWSVLLEVVCLFVAGARHLDSARFVADEGARDDDRNHHAEENGNDVACVWIAENDAIWQRQKLGDPTCVRFGGLHQPHQAGDHQPLEHCCRFHGVVCVCNGCGGAFASSQQDGMAYSTVR